MARISVRDFVGTRARLQRLRDAKLFNGWIEGFYGNNIEVSTSTDSPVEIGDEFRVEGFGHHISAVFNATIESVGTFDVIGAGGFQAIEGSNARILEAKRASLKMVVVSPVRYAASGENARYLVADLYTVLSINGLPIEGSTVDVSPTGLGVLVKVVVDPGSHVQVQLQTNLGVVTADGLVRYCRPDKEREGHYRLGIKFTHMGRIERPRWDRFVRELN